MENSRAFRLSVIINQLLLIGLYGVTLPTHAAEKRILVLYSYYDSSPWQRLLKTGFYDELASISSGDGVALFEEHVDAVRLDETQAMDAFKSYIKKKYAGEYFDVVAAEDIYANKILYQDPLLFSGAQRFYIDHGFGDAWVPTDGVAFKTRARHRRALEAIMQIMPQLQRLIVVKDSSQLGDIYQSEWEKIALDYSNVLSIELFDNFSYQELLEKSKQLPKNTAILYLPVFHDKTGLQISPVHTCKQLADVASVPVFVHHDTFIGTGAVGGLVYSAEQLGHVMGKLLLGKISNSTNLQNDPFISIIDYQAWQRFGFDNNHIPVNSKIINHKIGLWEDHFWQIALGLLIVVLETGLLILLFIASRSRRNALAALNAAHLSLEQKVKERTKDLAEALDFNDTILHNTPLAMGVYSPSGQCVMANKGYANLMKTSQEYLLSQNFNDVESWGSNGLLEKCLTALNSHQRQQREVKLENIGGEIMWLDCHIFPTPINGKQHLLIQLIDLTARKRMEKELRHIAFHDSLTQLPNRRLLLDRLAQAIRSCKRQNTFLAVLFLDLDKFKPLNDTYGHDVGDLLLIEVARRLTKAIRNCDTVARLGGDEFIVLLEGLSENPDHAAEYANLVAEKIRGALSIEYILGNVRHYCSVSIGIKLFAGTGEDVDQLIKEADAAMYEAKKSIIYQAL